VLAGLLGATVILAAFAPWPAQLASALSVGILYLYSTGPRLKAIPVVGSLMNVGIFTPVLYVGMHNASLPPDFARVALAFSALLLQNQLIHEAADQVEDRGGGVRTTWLTLGPRWTALFAGVVGLGAMVAAPQGLYKALSAVGIGVFVAAFPLLLARRGADWRQAARLRIAHRWCAAVFGMGLFICWHWTI
jgi:4-hydroxybenzoate polyprenyltransferase